ncbi:hypothetical protein NLX83_22935 [Allokutzneria sp. A3M-2-11 16]|uniref:hypothetical protein n=1 Tax=Allokutzneria sp. A3M-2-11 16 TaxID=2962043 RepID=UPI0020B78D2F|nr:hypothetical protein [Allokutzneria sp. A3M-2-11 16]MCP3802126.1 hypothetical protein [Allokutzneria sp. A3M-2-11 16]
MREHSAMPLVYLDKPPLPVPAALGLSNRTRDYDDLPPTPPGLPEHSWVRTIREVRELLPRQLLGLFAHSVDTAASEDLMYVVDDWAIFAGNLHDSEYQATWELIDQDRIDELLGDDPLTQRPMTDAELGPPPPGERMFVNGREMVWVND